MSEIEFLNLAFQLPIILQSNINPISPDFLNVLSNGGVAVVVFVIWFFTFKYFTKSQRVLFKEMLDMHKAEIVKYQSLVEKVSQEYQEALVDANKEHSLVIDRFIKFVEKGMEQQNYLNGLLIRFETQLKEILRFIEKNNKG